MNLPYHLAAGSASSPGSPFFADHAIYRNMLVPSNYNSPYHLHRFPSPEDLSRNAANTKALDLLQQHASQYYNTHKIHELNERVNQLSKSPNNTRINASSISNSSSIHGNTSAMSILPTANSENRAIVPSSTTQQCPVPLQNCDASKVIQLNAAAKLPQSTDRLESKDVNNRTSSPPPQR